YIIIPLTMVYTVILLIYVLLNITGDFWKDNLLEPMLISYAVIVILVFFLASSLDNMLVTLFKNIFPKILILIVLFLTIAYLFKNIFPIILIPIVLFQTIASFLKIEDTGVTYGRYYVIMFGLFALISGVVFSFFSMKKHGWIALSLIIFAIISITPPVDSFSV